MPLSWEGMVDMRVWKKLYDVSRDLSGKTCRQVHRSVEMVLEDHSFDFFPIPQDLSFRNRL